MPIVAQIGDVVHTWGEIILEWKIKEFFSLSERKYNSPVFSFADALWRLRLYPKVADDPEEGISTDNCGQDDDLSVENVELDLVREDSGPRQTINYAFGIKCSDGVEENEEQQQDQFSAKNEAWGEILWSRDDLQKQASRLVPGNVLTITCRLKCSEPHIAKVSSSSRVWELSRNMETVLDEGKRADFVLKLGDREWPVHKVILENRCEYFANMFRHDWVENTVGEVTFKDIEEEALDDVLDFVYTGCVDLSVDNVCGIYVAAHKFLLDGLKALCVEYMKGDMCLEIVCNILVIADTYGEEDLRHSAIEFFLLEEDQIFDSEEWKELKKCHGSVAAEILEEIRKREKKKRTKMRV